MIPRDIPSGVDLRLCVRGARRAGRLGLAHSVIDPYLPGSVPFITYFIAVAASGWVGGYGPAVYDSAMRVIARYLPDSMSRASDFELLTPVDAVRLGSFVFVCLSMGGLTAALHSASCVCVQMLDNQLKAIKSGSSDRVTAAAPLPDQPPAFDLVPETMPPRATRPGLSKRVVPGTDSRIAELMSPTML